MSEIDQSFFEELDGQLQQNLLERRILISTQHMLRIKFYLFSAAAVAVFLAVAAYVLWEFRFGDGFSSRLDIVGGSLGLLGAFVVVELILSASSALQATWQANVIIHAQDYAISQAEDCLNDGSK
jgi:hypothetical protein